MHNWEVLSSNRFGHKTQVVAMNQDRKSVV